MVVTGALALKIALKVKKVIAIDVSEEMLNIVKEKAKKLRCFAFNIYKNQKMQNLSFFNNITLTPDDSINIFLMPIFMSYHNYCLT